MLRISSSRSLACICLQGVSATTVLDHTSSNFQRLSPLASSSATWSAMRTWECICDGLNILTTYIQYSDSGEHGAHSPDQSGWDILSGCAMSHQYFHPRGCNKGKCPPTTRWHGLDDKLVNLDHDQSADLHNGIALAALRFESMVNIIGFYVLTSL